MLNMLLSPSREALTLITSISHVNQSRVSSNDSSHTHVSFYLTTPWKLHCLASALRRHQLQSVILEDR